MAYQKLQLITAAQAIPSDDVLIPVPTSDNFSTVISGVAGSNITAASILKSSATITAGGTTYSSGGQAGIKITAGASTFLSDGIVEGDKYVNTTLNISSRIIRVISDTELLLDLQPTASGAIADLADVADSVRIYNKNNFVDACNVGDTIVNTTVNEATFITSIVSEVEMVVSTIGTMAGTNAITAYTDPNANIGCILYIGGAGNVKVRTASGQDVTYIGLNAATWLPVQITKLFSTGTTATNMVVNW